MPLWINDYNYGVAQELKVLPIIKNFFNKNIQQSPSRTAKHDYFDDESNLYELKSRTNSLRAYPTTMITENKVIGVTDPLYLLFNYTDCLAFIKYDEDAFKNYPRELFGRASGGLANVPQPHIKIPIEHLSVIQKW